MAPAQGEREIQRDLALRVLQTAGIANFSCILFLLDGIGRPFDYYA
jgi:hypothetical protein